MTDELGYEAARAELADVVRKLESGGPTLEESLRLWERGEQLADLCQRWLQGATARLDEALAQREATGAVKGGSDSDPSGSGDPVHALGESTATAHYAQAESAKIVLPVMPRRLEPPT